ncbi:DUF4352 domain-containing protein [Nocardiopsis sp. JB363]|uniref:DUF4352 domain-containing protein n=1 Tax=Nocardiopsis sp. JB363 TaxID=1434837 RepID=UPI001F248697|nr:DUF4352 domain-containing protein [Nocardiopsis sp. JB363]
MTQPHPQPFPPQQPYQPMPPKQGMSTGKKLGLGCGAFLLLFFLMGGCMAALSGGSDGSESAQAPSEQTEDTAEGEVEEAAEEPAEDEPVVLTAEAADFVPSVLHDGGDYTSVHVAVENNGDTAIEVNPLYFALVADDGTKKDTTSALGMSESQIDTVTLDPGQRAEGLVTAEGDFTPASVEFEENLGLGVTVTADIG